MLITHSLKGFLTSNETRLQHSEIKEIKEKERNLTRGFTIRSIRYNQRILSITCNLQPDTVSKKQDYREWAGPSVSDPPRDLVQLVQLYITPSVDARGVSSYPLEVSLGVSRSRGKLHHEPTGTMKHAGVWSRSRVVEAWTLRFPRRNNRGTR